MAETEEIQKVQFVRAEIPPVPLACWVIEFIDGLEVELEAEEVDFTANWVTFYNNWQALTTDKLFMRDSMLWRRDIVKSIAASKVASVTRKG